MGLHDFTKIPNGVNGLEDRMSVIWERGAGKYLYLQNNIYTRYPGRCPRGHHDAGEVRGGDLHRGRQDLQHLPAEGSHRPGLGRGCGEASCCL